jgi:hypothetical protein
MEHGSVIGFVERAETGSEGTDALVAIDLKIENVDDESVAGFGAVDEERAGERIVAVDEGKWIAGLLDDVAEAVERVGFEDVAGVEMSDGRGDAVEVFHVVDGGVILDDVGRGGSLSEDRNGDEKKEEETEMTHGEPPNLKTECNIVERESQTEELRAGTREDRDVWYSCGR